MSRKRTRDPKCPTDVLGRAYPLGTDPETKKKRLGRYALESLLVPAGVVILELYLAFYRSWDAETYQVSVPMLVISFVGVYAIYFLGTLLFTERRVNKYTAWKESTFHRDDR